MTDKSTEKWSSLAEVAEHLGVSKDTIYRWVAKKQIPAGKIGHLWKFKISQVDEWVENTKANEQASALIQNNKEIGGVKA
ncbi:MAG: helix-turn-helix domain-containing protein [Actinomycetia bacterium]|nr:helix-turn-helix domain-containing protein [Actinomycetes bacterium]